MSRLKKKIFAHFLPKIVVKICYFCKSIGNTVYYKILCKNKSFGNCQNIKNYTNLNFTSSNIHFGHHN